jgi:L-threonylcarbamoyladenylate synthase
MPKTLNIKAHIYRNTTKDINTLSRILKQGGLVAVPTETVYGLAANALNAKACRAIFKAKGRPTQDPLIVHIHTLKDITLIAEINYLVAPIARAFWPGPLTLILPKKTSIPSIVTSNLPSVAVRIPSHPVFRKLLKKTGLPLAAPSANPFGYVSPTTSHHVYESLGNKISYILEGGSCEIGVESTILDLRNPEYPKILRPGGISKNQIEKVIKRKVLISSALDYSKVNSNQVAPGLLKKHYSPRTPLKLTEHLKLPASKSSTRSAYLFIKKPKGILLNNIFYLSKSGNLKEAARNLFSKLRELDSGGWKKIYAEKAHGHAIACAINDRLQRAAAKTEFK